MPVAQVYGSERREFESRYGSAASPDEDVPLIKRRSEELHQAHQAPEATASPRDLVVNLIVGGLGTGVFTLPWSTAGASVVPALLIVALVLLLNAWTISILVQAAERHQTFDLGGLLGNLPGRVGRICQAGCNVGVWFSMFLCLVGYTVVTSSCAQSLVGKTQGGVFSHRYTLVTLSSAVVLPLCFLDQKRLSFTSVLGVMVFVVIFSFIAYCYVDSKLHVSMVPVCYYGISTGSIAMVSAMMQAIIVQMCVLPMYAELKDRTPAKFNKVVAVAFSCLFLIFGGFAVLGYFAFGEHVQSSVLDSFPPTPAGRACSLSAGLGVLAVYPIMMSPMVAPLRSTDMGARLGLSHDTFMAIATILIVLCVTVATIVLPNDLGLLNVVNGAVSLGLFVALAPGLIGLHLLGRKNAGWRLAMYALIFGGIALSILGLVYTDNYASLLGSTCRWGSKIV